MTKLKKGKTMAAKKPNRTVTTKRTTKKSVKNTNFLTRFSTQKLTAIAFVIMFAGIGSYMLFKSFAASPLQAATARFAPDQFLISFRPGVDNDRQHALLGRYGAAVKKDIPEIGTKVITVNPKALDAVVAALSHNPAVEFAEKDWVAEAADTVPNDPYFPPSSKYGGQWGMYDDKTQMSKAWDVTTGSANTVIAIIDSGIASHPDLVNNIVTGHNVLDNSASTEDTFGHGTYVAGAAAEVGNNATGSVGYCFGCKVMPIKSYTTNTGAYSSDIANGITWATDHGAKVINISLAGTASSSTVTNAVSYARQRNVVVIAAAGNSACNCLTYPAATPGVIGVAATDQLDSITGYSNFGSWVKIGAPTGPVVPTLTDPYTGAQWGYAPVGGTSLSSPVVAGIAGLLFSAKPTATNTEVEQALLNNTNPCCGGKIGGGRVNAYKALQAITGNSPPPDTIAPMVNITYPASGSTVSGSIVMTADATDNTQIYKVEFYLDGVLSIADNTSPYSWYVTTTNFANGSHTLQVRAYDTAGNMTPTSTTFTISNGSADTTSPTASLVTPATGSTVSGNTTVSASSSDNSSVTGTELYIDGLLRSSSTTSTISYTWDTNQETNGSHTLMVKAYDAAGNVGTSPTVSVTVSNLKDTVAPVATVTSPAANSVVIGNVVVAASATDNVAVTKLEIYIDGKLKATSATSTATTTWNTKSAKKGTHTITVKAYDAAGNFGQSTINVIKQ